jgi:hypothetical protein
MSDLIENLRALARYVHDDMTVASDAADEIERLRTVTDTLAKTLEECRFALEPYDDIKPRDWSTDRMNLRRAHQGAVAAFAAIAKAKGEPR